MIKYLNDELSKAIQIIKYLNIEIENYKNNFDIFKPTSLQLKPVRNLIPNYKRIAEEISSNRKQLREQFKKEIEDGYEKNRRYYRRYQSLDTESEKPKD